MARDVKSVPVAPIRQLDMSPAEAFAKSAKDAVRLEEVRPDAESAACTAGEEKHSAAEEETEVLKRITQGWICSADRSRACRGRGLFSIYSSS